MSTIQNRLTNNLSNIKYLAQAVFLLELSTHTHTDRPPHTHTQPTLKDITVHHIPHIGDRVSSGVCDCVCWITELAASTDNEHTLVRHHTTNVS